MKYKILKEESIEHNGIALYRIQALKTFSDVKKGDIGGFIQSEKNLSQENDCWVYDNAFVYDNANVFGNALVYGDALVYGKARVSDSPN